MDDWPTQTSIACLVNKYYCQLYPECEWPFDLPSLAASEKEIEEAEIVLGEEFDQKYRDFLRYANGWKKFSQFTYIFGTRDFLQKQFVFQIP